MSAVTAPQPAVGAPLLEFSDIEFAYDQLQVLFGVSAEVYEGEALALLGTNGAGKSTLLKVLCGLERPSRGTVLFAGTDITGLSAEALTRNGLALISGGKSVFPDMSVSDNLEMQAFTVRKQKRWASERRAYVLETFPRLGERLQQPAGALSGGEQQQLAMAKALLLAPKVLCIDELSLGLAPIVVQGLMSLVDTLRRDGMTIILVEQSLNIAASMCQRAIFMEKGAVRFTGATQELVDNDDVARAVFLSHV